MTMTAERLRLLHGSAAPLPDLQTLRAGPVTMLLDGVDLRYLRLGDTELVRRVYVAVRDVDWDTVPATVSGLQVEQTDAWLDRHGSIRRCEAVMVPHGRPSRPAFPMTRTFARPMTQPGHSAP